MMQVIPTAIPDVLMLEPRVFGDARGFFMESWNARAFNEAVGHQVAFVQDNHSRSVAGVLRGLHYQLTQPQGKLMRVISGRVFDVVVDMRAQSPTLGQSVCVELSADNHRQLWVPPGFAHGFLVLSDSADVLYKATDYYHPSSEVSVSWCDPELGIEWPIDGLTLQLSAKDKQGIAFADAPRL